MTWENLVDLLKVVFGGGGLIGAAIALWKLWWEQAKYTSVAIEELEWRKAQSASEIVREWDQRVGKHREELERLTGIYWTPEPVPVPATAQTDRSFGDSLPNDKHYELKKTVLEVMNYMEIVASLYLKSMIDEEFIDALLKPPMIKLYKRCELLADAISKSYAKGTSPADAWPVLTDLMVKWGVVNRSSQPIGPVFTPKK